jgi:hypothetical protein
VVIVGAGALVLAHRHGGEAEVVVPPIGDTLECSNKHPTHAQIAEEVERVKGTLRRRISEAPRSAHARAFRKILREFSAPGTVARLTRNYPKADPVLGRLPCVIYARRA